MRRRSPRCPTRGEGLHAIESVHERALLVLTAAHRAVGGSTIERGLALVSFATELVDDIARLAEPLHEAESMVDSGERVDLVGCASGKPRANEVIIPEIGLEEVLTVLDVGVERAGEPRGMIDELLAELGVVGVAGELVDGDHALLDVGAVVLASRIGARALDMAVDVVADQNVLGILGIGRTLPPERVPTLVLVMTR